jgi:hypothetical protein
MANRNRIPNRRDAHETLLAATRQPLPSSRKSELKEKTDDVIVSLSDAYENRRARQVGEWERLYSDNVYRAV